MKLDNILAFNDLGSPISLDYLKYKTYLKLLMSPTKIWLNGNKYGIFWEVLQVKIYPKTMLNKYTAFKKGKNVMLTIPNPNAKAEPAKPFIRVNAKEVWRNPNEVYMMKN